MSINAWVDQGDEINGNGNFFADTMVEIDASANTLLAGITVFSGGGTGSNSGAAGLPPAYAEKYESGSWTSKPLLFNEQGTSNLDDPAGDGGAISEDGNIIVVGEPAFDNSSNSNNAEGRISLFRYDSTSGSYKGLNGTDASGTVILAPTEGANQKFGNRVAFSRDTSGVSPNPIVPSVLVVGEPNDEGDNTKNGGKIYTYQWGTTSANAYSLISGLTLSGTSGDAATREEFGNYPIKLNDAGTRIIIGAENGTNSKGQAIVYGRADLTTTTWTQVGAKIAAPNSDYHQFGKGVAIDGSGDIIAISDPKYGGGGASGVGASAPGQVLIYEYNASTWVQKGPAITGNYYTSTDTGDKEGRNIGISRDGNYVFSTANHAFGGKLNYPIDTSGAGLDASLNYNVDVAGGKFRLWEESQVNLNAFLGNTLYFYQVDATNSGHPLVIGTGADSNTLGEGRDVSYNNSGGSGTVIFKPSTAGTYYYYCSNHSGMGSLITILDPAGGGDISYNVSVAGGEFYFSTSPIETPGQGINDLSFNAYAGQTITFDQSHSSNGDGGGNTIALSESPDGTHNSGADFTTNVEYDGDAGSSGILTWTVTKDNNYSGYYYYSKQNSGYGNTNAIIGKIPYVGRGQMYKYDSGTNTWGYHGTPIWGNLLGTGLGHAGGMGDSGEKFVIGEGTHDDSGIARVATFMTTSIDTTGPVIAPVTTISNPTTDNTPSYVFSSNEAGQITFDFNGTGLTVSTGTSASDTDDNTVTFNTVPDGGPYSGITIKVTDTAGNDSNILTIPAFTVDTTNPTFSNIVPSSASAVNTSTVTYDLDETINSGTVIYTRTDGTSGSATHNLTGSQLTSGTGKTITNPVNTLVDGAVYRIAFSGTDAAGLTGTTEVTNITYDTTAPTITGVSLATDNTTIAVTFSEAVYNSSNGSGALEMTDFVFTLSGGVATLSSATPSSISPSGNVYTLGISLSGTPNGSETLTVNPAEATSIYDVAGNAASTTQSNNTHSLYDKTSPTFTFTVPSTNDITNSNNITYNLNEDVVAGATVIYTRTSGTPDSGSPHTVNLNATDRTNGSGKTLSSPPTLVSGTTYTISFSGDDSAGNNGAAEVTNITYDATAPTASIAYDSTGPYRNGETVRITANFNEDMANPPAPQMQIEIAGPDTASVSATNMTYVSAIQYYYDYAVPTQNGTGTISLRTGTDLAGNLITTIPTSGATFTVDNTGPTLTQVTPVGTLIDGVYRTNDTTPTYVFSCGESNCEISASDRTISTINGSSFDGTSFPVAINNGNNTIVFATLTSAGKRGTEYPTNNNGITVQDAIGNATTIQVNTFTIDTTAPVIEQVAVISTPSSTNSPTYVFKSDEQGTITVGHASSSALNGFSPTTISSAEVNTNINLQWTGLAEGTYSGYYINVTDDVGNVSNTLTIPNFTVDTLGPTVTQTSNITTPSNDNTPSFTFQTTEGGVLTTTVSQGFSAPTNANISLTDRDITFTFNALLDGTYSGKQIIVTDSTGNAGTCTLNTFVIDTTGPSITILGDNPATVEKGSTYVDSGATASEGATVIVASNNVNTGVVRTDPDYYTVTYTATDNANNTTTATRTVYVEDTRPPVITLDGDNPMYVEWITGTFTDPGASTDDGTVVSASGSVDVNTINTDPGYIITYNATDSAGNEAVAVTRTVYVRDTAAPVITVLGSGTDPTNPFRVERGSTYTDPNPPATATDITSGDLNSDIKSTITNSAGTELSAITTLIAGIYTITYNVSDSAGNAAIPKTRTVKVEDGKINDPPSITTSITSDNENNQLAKAGDYVTINIVETGIDVFTITSTALQIDGTAVNSDWISTSNPGTNVSVNYLVQAGDNGDVTFTIGLKDEYDNATTISATTDGTSVTVDTTGPTISLIGGNETIERGTIATYSDPGATSDGGETVTASPSQGDATYVNPNVVGSYFITYTASDPVGNSTTATRSVNVVDTTPPVITILGSNPFTVERTQSYSDAGFTTNEPTTNTTVFKDSLGNTITEVNTNVSGQYFAQYTAIDPYGNSATATRTINVQDTTAPIITVIGDNPYSHEQYNEYNDPGATTNEGTLTTIGLPLSSSDVNALGATYTITYTATDAAGLVGSATRVVNIVPDTTAPVITIIGRNPAYVDFEKTYNDEGATSDGGETVTSVSTVDTGVLGQYKVTYSATDTAGNTGTAVRIVYVVDPLDLEKTDVLGGPFNGYSATQNVLNYSHGEQAQIRSQLRNAWNLENAKDSINGKGRAIGAFRAVTNAGDYLSRDNYQCNAPCQVDCVSGANYNTKKNNCDDTGVAAWSGNPKYVYDSSDFIRFKKQQATQDNYNDNAR